MKSITSTLDFGNVKHIGHKTCDVCESEVPIYENVIKGKVIRSEVCINCEDQKLQQKAMDHYKERKRKRFNRICEIPEDVKGSTFNMYRPQNDGQQKALEYCVGYARKFPDFNKGNHSLVLTGKPGLGKTHLSYCVAKAISNKGYSVTFIPMPDLLTKIRETYDRNSEMSEEKLLTLLKDVDLLVLDDIGAEYIKESEKESWAVDKIYQIINSRQNKPTIYTTNYSSEQLANRYGSKNNIIMGERIVSRMKKGTYPINLTGKDYRTKSTNEIAGF